VGEIRYRDQEQKDSERIIWPILIGYAETVRLLAAWCELRQEFRHFRTDRIAAKEFLEKPHGQRVSALRNRWKRHMATERGLRLF
jgi:predicted DNA-binding transcriptional regulator YafY